MTQRAPPAALRVTLGRPARAARGPCVASPGWSAARANLRAALAEEHEEVRVRSPAALWGMVHGGTMPRKMQVDKVIEREDPEEKFIASATSPGLWRILNTEAPNSASGVPRGYSEEHRGGWYEKWYVFEFAQQSGVKMRQQP